MPGEETLFHVRGCPQPMTARGRLARLPRLADRARRVAATLLWAPAMIRVSRARTSANRLKIRNLGAFLALIRYDLHLS